LVRFLFAGFCFSSSRETEPAPIIESWSFLPWCLCSELAAATEVEAVQAEELFAVARFLNFGSAFLLSIHLQYLERIEVEIKISRRLHKWRCRREGEILARPAITKTDLMA
jgi:hypothetical protein